MRRTRGGDVSLPPPPKLDQQAAAAAAAAAPQLQRGRDGMASIGRATEIGGEMDQLGDGAGGLAAMQRVNELLDKRGLLSKEFCLECVRSSSSVGVSQCGVCPISCALFNGSHVIFRFSTGSTTVNRPTFSSGAPFPDHPSTLLASRCLRALGRMLPADLWCTSACSKD